MDGNLKKASIFDKNKHYSDLPQDVIDFSSAYKVSCCSLFFFELGGYEPFIVVVHVLL